MTRTFGIVGVAVFVLFFFATAHAQTSAQLQAELNALLEQLAALQTQLQVTSGTANTAPAASGSVYGACPNLTRSLRKGMSGSDVTALQAFLAADARIYPEGTISGYFGPLTQKAVQALQLRHNLVTSGTPESTGYGAVGPATRNLIASLCKGGGISTPSASGGNCSLGGITTVNGLTADFYSVTAAPAGSSCAAHKQTRQCISGNFSGDATYQYGNCSDTVNQCIVNGVTIANGASQTFHSRLSVNAGESCSSYAQTRTCTNGVLSGTSNFIYVSCTVDTPDSCVLGAITIAHGSSRTFYTHNIATSTNSCSAYGQSRTCNDGVLSGSGDYNKAACTAGICEIDGITLQSGESKTFYFAKNIPSSEQCSSYAQTRSCVNGTLGGVASYKYASCAPAASGTCVVDSVVLSNGQSATFYSTTTAAVGTTCVAASQTRTCTSGTLGGSATYNRASCTDTKPCSLDGVNVSHGESFTFYSARTVDFGSTCSGVSLTRACSNGALSGNSSYQYGSCSVNPPVSSLSNAQLAAALAALESLLRSALETLATWF